MEGLDGAVGTYAQTQPLCIHSGSGLGDRVLGEEKRIVLYLCLQRGPQWACASKSLWRISGEFYSSGLKGVADKIRVCAGPLFL